MGCFLASRDALAGAVDDALRFVHHKRDPERFGVGDEQWV